MGVTYTSATTRGARPGRAWWKPGADDLPLAIVGLLSLTLLAFTYVGRLAALDTIEASRAGTPVTLTAAVTADDVAAALSPVFDSEHDRRFAAAAVVRALQATDSPHVLPNVGALAGLTVTAREIDSTRGLDRFAAHLAEARSHAAAVKGPAPVRVPVFTTAELAALKPSFTVRTRDAHRTGVIWCAFGLLALFPLMSFTWRWRGVPGDRLLLAAVHLLIALGAVAMLARPDPLRDSFLLVRYTEGVLLGGTLCLAISILDPAAVPFVRWPYLSLLASLVLALVLMVFGSGPGTSGAKVNLGPLQPVEMIRLLLIFFLAGYLGRRWELVRQVRETAWRGRALPGWLNVPRIDHIMPVLGGVALSLILFFALRDLGPALLVSITFLALLSVARAGAGALIIGAVVLAAGFVVGYWLEISNTLTVRMSMWQAPWDNAVRGGDQVAQAAWALAAGAWSGTGLGLGDTRFLPAGHTDLVLAAIAEELGVVGTLAVAAAVVVVAWRGLRLARQAESDGGFFLALGLTLSLTVPVLVMAGGAVGLVPLTGVVTPFVSYGGSAMIANFTAVGLLMSIGRGNAGRADLRPFDGGVRGVALGLAACAVVVAGAWMRIQAVSPDALVVKPQLSLQADGGRRFQYNPRVLEAARSLPRGTIFDRRDVPLAGDIAAVTAGKVQLDRLGASLREACPDATARCYPFGGRTYHLVGDANSRVNWAASNTSFVERDAESLLRGFDDRATSVPTGDVADAGVALRRDYSDLIPLIRHKWEPDHDAVRRIRERSRDVHLTIDARLQSDVAALTARALSATGATRAAVVVLDAASGELLASVSYPWPGRGAVSADALLDRARYGLYPPGSTFKLVTAAAALSLDPSLHDLRFTCSRLPDGRAGVRIPGWGRPIRDDVLDRHAHGTQTMREGLVHSCNAYFAQLAVRLGVEPLVRMADAAGISYSPVRTASRARETLPHSGFGQGDVLATPLRMARVAAAIASDGQIREPGLIRTADVSEPKPFLSPASAQVLASDMRAVVTEGTGRLLRGHPVAIAGKTGTAEVDDAPSHAWFVGFAPSGPSSRRIAFAVLVEHAGYGGASAASLAGQVVSVAAGLGMVR